MQRSVTKSAAMAAVLLWPFAVAARDAVPAKTPLQDAVRQFTGQLRGQYMPAYPPLVSDQIMMGLGGPADFTDLPGGLQLITSCRVDSCTEKAAVIVSADGKVKAAAMIHFRCYWTKPPHKTRRGNLNGPSKCDSREPILTEFMRRSSQSDDLDKALRDWAAQVHDDAVKNFGKNADALAKPGGIVWVD